MRDIHRLRAALLGHLRRLSQQRDDSLTSLVYYHAIPRQRFGRRCGRNSAVHFVFHPATSLMTFPNRLRSYLGAPFGAAAFRSENTGRPHLKSYRVPCRASALWITGSHPVRAPRRAPLRNATSSKPLLVTLRFLGPRLFSTATRGFTWAKPWVGSPIF